MITCKIAGIVLELDFAIGTYFGSTLEQYRIPDAQEIDHTIRTVKTANLPIPDTDPTTVLSGRRIYKTDESETVLTIDETTQSPRHAIVKSADYSTITLYLNPETGMDLAELEYVWTGIVFFEIALLHGMTALHASAVETKGSAVLFSAPSGTGKSTQARLWKEFIPKCVVINDDKPLLEPTDQGIFVHGTPWSGKDVVNKNKRIPLKAIAFVEQAAYDAVGEMQPLERIRHLFRNTYRPTDADLAQINLSLIDKITSGAWIVRFACTMEESAAKTLHKYLYLEDRS
jgi:hypothetical protein